MYRIAAIALGSISTANAEPMPYDIDANHSRIWFDVSHQGYSIMRGLFRDFDGSFNFDAENPAASTLDITIDAASINMFHEGLNDHLKRDDFFGEYERLVLQGSGVDNILDIIKSPVEAVLITHIAEEVAQAFLALELLLHLELL